VKQKQTKPTSGERKHVQDEMQNMPIRANVKAQLAATLQRRGLLVLGVFGMC
jgi:hypothetical protein